MGDKLSLLMQKIKFAEMNKTCSTETQEDRYFLIIVLSICKTNRTGVFDEYKNSCIIQTNNCIYVRKQNSNCGAPEILFRCFELAQLTGEKSGP